MKHRLQGDKKTLCLLYDTPRQAASDRRELGHNINSRPLVQARKVILMLDALLNPHERNSPKVLPEMSPPFQPQAQCYPGESAAHQQQRQ